MAKREDIMEGKKMIRSTIGNYKCPDCGTKVVNGDHGETECRMIAQQMKIFGNNITVMA